MILLHKGYAGAYEMESLAMMFFPGLRIGEGSDLPDTGDYIYTEISPEGDGFSLYARVSLGGKAFESREAASRALTEKERELALARALYGVLHEATGISLRWGILTGIRPLKLFHNAVHSGMSEAQVRDFFKSRYLTTDEMIDLSLDIQKIEDRVNAKSKPNSFSLYVSIPFCPSRCSYCSFVSHSIAQAGKLIPEYVRLLAQEIRETGLLAKELGLSLSTVYFGGGTPTTLSADELKTLFLAVEESFDLGGLLEYTVEAGRPDTIDREKLEAIKKAGVTRLSVNPQTLNDSVLREVGRRHTAADVVQAFALAKSFGFDCINMDLIAGLPADTLEGFERSVKGVLALRPENVTVHALTIKRSSDLAMGPGEALERGRALTTDMVDLSREAIRGAGFVPYYLYRQKNTVGNLDNTGYCLPGKEGYYNIFIMDETHTILSTGAGGVTKLCGEGKKEKIRRIFNFKFPYEYISRYGQIQSRKEQVKAFYEDRKQG